MGRRTIPRNTTPTGSIVASVAVLFLGSMACATIILTFAEGPHFWLAGVILFSLGALTMLGMVFTRVAWRGFHSRRGDRRSHRRRRAKALEDRPIRLLKLKQAAKAPDHPGNEYFTLIREQRDNSDRAHSHRDP